MTLEAAIESAAITYAESIGFETRKMQYVGRIGCRDRDFYGFGRTLKVEFKRPGEPLRISQARDRDKLLLTGVYIYVIDNLADLKTLLNWAKANPTVEAVCPLI